MRKFKTERRVRKITSAINSRQQSLRVIIENVHDRHNVSAILRSCDAVGVSKVSLLYTVEKQPKLSRITSSSANKWIETESFSDTEVCFDSLRREGFKIYSSVLNKNAQSIYDVDLTKKIAILVGNEHRGVSEEATNLSDGAIYIPMKGMIQSLNVSVATAVILYEAMRQRELNGSYLKSELSVDEIDKMIDEWCER